jgi:hypothetical protein
MPVCSVPQRRAALRQQHVLPRAGPGTVVIVKVTTLTGSTYLIDFGKKTWERVAETPDSGPVRTDGRGTWHALSGISEGFPMVIYGPPVDPAMAERRITTSPVTGIVPVEPHKDEL